MHRTSSMRGPFLVGAVMALGSGCDAPVLGPGSSPSDGTVVSATDGVLRATGGGRYLLAATFDTQFSLSAVQKSDGKVSGRFHQCLVADGLKVEFHGEVTCLAVDAPNGRAWIGGIITQNNSEDPDFRQAIHQPGRDIWFRLLDSGQEQSETDRITFMGFEGSAGVITSQEYCELKIWPDGNARTHPVTEGNIDVSQ